MLAGVGTGVQMLEAVFNPTHGMVRLHRQPGNRYLLRMQNTFVAEAASNVRSDYTDSSLLEAEAVGQAHAHDIWELRGTVHRELIHTAVPEGHYPLTLHRHGRLTAHSKLPLDHDRSLSRNHVEIAALGESLQYEVVAPVLVQQGRAGLLGFEHIHHDAQILVVDGNL